MNLELLQHIVKHVFASFAIIPSDFINLDRTKSLMNPEYLLPEKLHFEAEEGPISNKVWGCQLTFMKQDVKILLGDCTIPQPEDHQFRLGPNRSFAMLVSIKDMPIYGLFYDGDEQEPMIACTVDKKVWMECTTFLQATFLAGMEQLREVGMSWAKCSNYQDQFQHLSAFIKYHSATYEARDARQEERF